MYKVVYLKYFSQNDYDTYVITSNSKQRINDIAKSYLGRVYKIKNGHDIYLGKYSYYYSDCNLDVISIEWKPAGKVNP